MSEPSGWWARGRRMVANMPGVRQLRERAYDRTFASANNVNLYRGIFDTFEDASRSAPSTKPSGYDHAESAGMYGDLMEPTLRDYPAMFWLQRAFDDGYASVFDLGGHIGIKYYAFRHRMRMPAGFRWQVCDVPAVVQRGSALAAEKGVAASLSFTDDWRSMSKSDILFASGSVQYLPTSLGEMLRSLAALPARVVINNAALHPSKSFYTLNSIGVSFCAYRVQSEASFTSELHGLGYRCLDRWESPRPFAIPFNPGYEMNRFVGLSFER